MAEAVGDEGAGALGVFGVSVCDEGEEAREEVAREGLVRWRGVGLEEEGADAVGGDFGCL